MGRLGNSSYKAGKDMETRLPFSPPTPIIDFAKLPINHGFLLRFSFFLCLDSDSVFYQLSINWANLAN